MYFAIRIIHLSLLLLLLSVFSDELIKLFDYIDDMIENLKK